MRIFPRPTRRASPNPAPAAPRKFKRPPRSQLRTKAAQLAHVHKLAERAAVERIVAAGFGKVINGKLVYTEAGKRWRATEPDLLAFPPGLTRKK